MIGTVEKLLGFAIKANKIAFGIDNILKKRICLVIVSASLSESSLKKLKSAKKGVLVYQSSEDVGVLVRREGCKAVGITDSQMAKAIINNFDSNYQRITVEEN